MNNFKKVLAVSLAIFCGVFASYSFAGTSIHGSVCMPYLDTGSNFVSRSAVGAGNSDSSRERRVICPVPVDHTIGSLLQFRVKVNDQSNQTGLRCQGVAVDGNGNLIASSAMDQTGTSFTGTDTLNMSISKQSSTSYTYAVVCYVPASIPSRRANSEIRNIRVY